MLGAQKFLRIFCCNFPAWDDSTQQPQNRKHVKMPHQVARGVESQRAVASMLARRHPGRKGEVKNPWLKSVRVAVLLPVVARRRVVECLPEEREARQKKEDKSSMVRVPGTMK